MRPRVPSRNERGRWAEDLAAERLTANGLEPVQRNCWCNWEEIDLVMQVQQTLVFVEFRFRKSGDYGDGAQSVDARKQHKLISSAAHYLQTHANLQHTPCRFDIVSVSPKEVSWVKDAFHA